jgi:predicted RND superfamily exporter protein
MSKGQGAGGDWRVWIEARFERWGHLVYRQRWIALATSAAVTVWLASFVPGLTVDNSTESFLLPDDPAVIVYNNFRDEFGRDDRVILAVSTSDVFRFEVLEQLRALHLAIEEQVPHVEEVESLLNARVTRGVKDELIVGEFLGDWPETQEDLERLRTEALAHPLYRNNLISADGRVAALAIKPSTYSELAPESDLLAGFADASSEGGPTPVYLTAPEGSELVDGLLELMKDFEREDFRLHLAGALVMTHRIDAGMTRDLTIFLPTTLALMCVVLALLFRRVGGILLPLMVVLLSLVATLGVMILLGIPSSTVVQILPIFLLTVGVCDAVHILALIYRARMEGLDKESSLARALGHSGLAVLMTSLTTAAGMTSFVTAEMAAVKHLGYLAPIGVFLALVYTLVLLPALVAIFPLPAPRARGGGEGVFPFERFLVSAGSFAVRHPVRILLPTALLTLLALLGALQTRFAHDALSWFPADDRVVLDFQEIDRALGGSVSLDVWIDAREPGALYEPALLREVDRFGRSVRHVPLEPLFIGSTLSLIDIVKETHQALNENRIEMWRIPETREAVAQELLLFENSGSLDTEEVVDSEYRRTRMSLRVPFGDALLYKGLLADVGALLGEQLGDRVDTELTGLMTLLANIFDAVIKSMMRSYLFALAVITPLMMLLLGSLRRGFVSMLPNLLPVLAVLGVMGWSGLALDSTTMLVGAMVIGIAVDDTIHFMHKFHRYYEETDDLEWAVRETLRTTGSALLFTTLVLAAGFAIFEFSEMGNLRIFGGLSAMAALVAFAADLLVAPALLAVVEGRRSRERMAARKLAGRAAGGRRGGPGDGHGRGADGSRG